MSFAHIPCERCQRCKGECCCQVPVPAVSVNGSSNAALCRLGSDGANPVRTTHLAENSPLARLLFIEVLSAGPIALDRVEVVMDRLTALFNPGAVPVEMGTPRPEIVVEAIGAGIFVVIQNEVAQERTEALGELLGEISFIVLAPFGVE
jgi:hypothetical protein